MKDQMRVAVLKAPRTFEVVDRPRPTPQAGEAVVRIAATAVCHGDLDLYLGSNKGARYPIVLGHEATGTVESVAPDVTGLRPGQNVLINPVITCGHCDLCLRGLAYLCRNAGLFGREIEGSMSQYVRLPARYLHPLPSHQPLPAATIIETLSTVRHAQERTHLVPGESVVVLGQGTTGLLHTALAFQSGCHPVIAVSRTAWKLEQAARMGAHHTVERSAEQAVDEVLRLTGGLGADAVIDTAGGPTTFKAGVDMLRPGGRLCSFSLSHEPIAGLSTFPIYLKEVSIIGARAMKAEDIDAAIELVSSGKIEVSGFISTTYPLEKVADAFEEYEHNPSRILRIIIDSGANP
jgi:2-desacetyl-2-hydroxyethyl bacteriochlorophyllide A dehydrogenase